MSRRDRRDRVTELLETFSLTEKRASASVISESRGGAAHPPVIGRIAGDVPRDGACRPESQ